jgi:hypothetical protein
MMAYLIAQLCLVLFNLGNACVDSHRIMMGKRIYHGLNIAAYLAFTGLLCLLLQPGFGVIIVFAISAGAIRQLSFDIPLNLMRGLKWDYVSLAKPPKSITDRVEIWLFGYNGQVPVVCYTLVWLACLIVKIFL